MPLPGPAQYIGQDDFSDSSTEDSFLLYKNMQRLPNIPMPVFKKPSTRVFSKVSPSVARVRKSMISHLMLPRKKSLISSTPRNPSYKSSASQDSSLQLSPIKARANSILAGNFENVKQTQNVWNGLPKLSLGSNNELELRLSKSYDTQPAKKVKQINTSVRNVVQHLSREMLKKKRKSIGKLVPRKSNGVLKENLTLTNQLTQQSDSATADSGTVLDTKEKKPPIALQSEKPKPFLKKMHLMERETQTTDSLNKGLSKLSIGNEKQNSSKKSITLRNSSRNEADDATIEEFLEQFDADVAAHRPSIITISSASEYMSPDTTSNNSQEPPESTSQHSYNNNIISDSNLKTKNVALMQNNNLEISSSKEKHDVKNSFNLNVSHNTRSFRSNTMSKANNDQPAKEEKRMRTKNSSNHNQKQLQNVNSASENMSPVVSSNTIISDANLKTKNVALMQNNNLEISSSNEKPDVNKSSQLNVSHNTRSLRNNSMSKANNDQPAKEEKRMRTKNSSNHNRKQLQNVNSASENMSPVVTSNNLQEQPEPDNQNSYRKDNNNASFKEEKASNSAAAANKSTSRQMNTKNKETPTNTSKITRTKRQTVNSNCNYSELDNSPEVVKKSRRRKTVSKSSKGKSRSSRNSTDRKEDKRSRNSKSVSTAVSRKSKASTSKVMNFQPYFYNRVSGYVQIEHNHPTLNFINQTTEGDRKSVRVRRAPPRYIQSTVIAPVLKTRRTRSTRQSAAQQPSNIESSTTSEFTNTNRSNLESTAADNENVFKKPLVRSSAKRRGRPPNTDTSAVRKKLKSITSSVDTIDNEDNQTDCMSSTKNHDFTEGVDSGAYTMSKEISLRTVTARSSPGPSCSYWNDNVPVNSILPEQSEETSKSPNLPVGSISHEQSQEVSENNQNVIIHENVIVQPSTETSTNLEKTVIEVPSQIETSVPKPVKESCKKCVTFNEAQTSTNPLAKTLFPPHNETEYSRRLSVFDDDVQHDEEKEPQNRQNEELDQNTLYTVINNEVVGIEWISSMPSSQTSKSSQGVTVTYFLNNLKIQQGTMSNGLIRFDPGQHRIQVTKKHCIVYRVEQGQATINIQLQKRNVGVGCCFHIPLGSTYSITNLSEVEPLVLFFTKVSAS